MTYPLVKATIDLFQEKEYGPLSFTIFLVDPLSPRHLFHVSLLILHLCIVQNSYAFCSFFSSLHFNIFLAFVSTPCFSSRCALYFSNLDLNDAFYSSLKIHYCSPSCSIQYSFVSHLLCDFYFSRLFSYLSLIFHTKFLSYLSFHLSRFCFGVVTCTKLRDFLDAILLM